jgi:hypothetical protein
MMKAYPLIFKFTRPIKTDNYHVVVSTRGRILMKQEFEKWWVYGVAPGGLAESGESPKEAYFNFMNSFWEIIQDISCEQQDYFSFMNDTNSFIKTASHPEEEEWQEARNTVRSNQMESDDPFNDLEKITRESYPNATYERLDTKQQTCQIEDNKNSDQLLLVNSEKVA